MKRPCFYSVYPVLVFVCGLLVQSIHAQPSK